MTWLPVRNCPAPGWWPRPSVPGAATPGEITRTRMASQARIGHDIALVAG